MTNNVKEHLERQISFVLDAIEERTVFIEDCKRQIQCVEKNVEEAEEKVKSLKEILEFLKIVKFEHKQ